MAKRKVNLGLMSYVRADTPADTVLWGFGVHGAEVDVHASDLERFDRLNEPAPTVQPALVLDDGGLTEPPRSGRGSSVDAWTTYAESLGLIVAEGASRDELIAHVDDSK